MARCQPRSSEPRWRELLRTIKYPNAFFLKRMGLVSAQYMADLLVNPGLTPDEFPNAHRMMRKWRDDRKTLRFFVNAHTR